MDIDNGKESDIPSENVRENLIRSCHERFSHRGITTVFYELRKSYFWPGIKKQIEDFIKRCEICQKYNRKTSKGCEFISTTRYLEKVGLDLIDFRSKGLYVIIAIDYFTRRIWGRPLINKGKMKVIGFLKDLCKQGKKPEEIVTDNGKEFRNDERGELCQVMDIKHHVVGIESHKSNGRV